MENQTNLLYVSGGWSKRKNIDSKLLYFFFDHWIFLWLPEKFRLFMRCGITSNEENESFQLEKSNPAVLQNYYHLVKIYFTFDLIFIELDRVIQNNRPHKSFHKIVDF